MLTPTEEWLHHYIARVLASVKRNWYAVMPEQRAWVTGEKSFCNFASCAPAWCPMRNPAMVGSSSKERWIAGPSPNSGLNAFEPLRAAFSGPFIELRFIFLYNPLTDSEADAATQVSGSSFALLCLVYCWSRNGNSCDEHCPKMTSNLVLELEDHLGSPGRVLILCGCRRATASGKSHWRVALRGNSGRVCVRFDAGLSRL